MVQQTCLSFKMATITKMKISLIDNCLRLHCLSSKIATITNQSTVIMFPNSPPWVSCLKQIRYIKFPTTYHEQVLYDRTENKCNDH
jgi:hypothetical protein